MESSFRSRVRLPLALLATAAFLVFGAGTASGVEAQSEKPSDLGPAQSGAAELRDIDLGHFITECPQAGRNLDQKPKPLDKRAKDDVEQNIARRSDDLRTNQDYSCFPQNETSIDTNPKNDKSLIAGANDYRLGTGSSGFYASTDEGKNWYDGIIPFPSAPAAQSRGEGFIPSGGDPAVVFDRAGIAYYAMIGFFRGNDTNGVFVSRSTNGGFTWSRGCVPVPTTPTGPPFVCGGTGDPRQPGDGVVTFNPDNNTLLDGSVPFNDKEYIAAGPRPDGVGPQCFTPRHMPTPCEEPRAIGVDRIYVTWTKFDLASPIFVSYSDDQGRSWSAEQEISGSASFCAFGTPDPDTCSDNQFSVPTVHPETGALYVAFENFNTPEENQYLVVRSSDGGQTFEGPFFVTPVFDVNYPRAGVTGGRPDCTARGQQNGRAVLTNSCFRVNSGGNIVVDPRDGEFADDLYVVISDNRSGNRASSNTDVFFFKSTDGGNTWLGPTRVNNDRSVPAPDRDCVPAACGGVGNFGNDQWFPWVDISKRGDVNVGFFDRRLDADSERAEWPTSRQRPGNYLSWFFGAVCTVSRTATIPPTGTTIPAAARGCLAREAAIIRQPVAPINPGPNPVPGQNQTELPYRNFQVSDVPSNFDYSFRAGIFIGDYNNVAIDDRTAWGYWTDARNGRSSGGPAGGSTLPSQPGRNPLCEQADVFLEKWNARNGGREPKLEPEDDLFLVTPCPEAATEEKSNDDG